MLFDVSRACGINPQVMLATLQKESRGLTRTDATESTYAAAWGWHCPDTGPGGTANCDPQHAGFVNQGYGMAHQWARYRVEIPNGKYNYQPGRTYDILWNVAESGCGGAPVTIANLATASLYVYTPYQPNAASLAAYPGRATRAPRTGTGTSSGCSRPISGPPAADRPRRSHPPSGAGDAGTGGAVPVTDIRCHRDASRPARTRCGTARTTPAR